MKILLRILGACALTLIAASAWAENPFPSKPVTIMVPYPDGGLSDAIARVVAVALSKELRQPVLVENLGGESGAIAARKVLGAPADGYYLFQGTPNEVILSPLLNATAQFKSTDFRMLQILGAAPLLIVTRKSLSASNPDELVALLRKSTNDKPMTFGSVGVGSLYHVLGVHLARTIGVQMTHVPYKGAAALVQGLVDGEVDFALLPITAQQVSLAEVGKIKLLGTLSPQRIETLKSLPSVNEGKFLRRFNFSIWSGYLVSKDTPEPAVRRLHSALEKILLDSEMRRQLQLQNMFMRQPQSLEEAHANYEFDSTMYRTIAQIARLMP